MQYRYNSMVAGFRGLLLIGGLLLPLISWAAQLHLEVLTQTVRENEAFNIRFTAEGVTDGSPDFTPLNQDFEVLSLRQGSQSTVVNGRRSQSISWTLNLIARRSGAVTIPAIQFGQDVSDPLSIQVAPEQAADAKGSAMFLKVSHVPASPYVQAQMIYTWQFYRRADLALAGASLSEPQLENAIRLPLGENRQFTTEVEGVEYVVTEGRYAIFPQQSGDLIIPPLVLTAEVSDQPQNANPFFRLQRTTTRRVKSEALKIQVKGIPVEFSGKDWLAASQLELSETWSDEALQAEVGQPLTRTLTLRAAGLLKSQLPELQQGLNDDNISSYADQAVLAEKPFINGVSALREQKFAIIATRPGVYTLPAIELPWFNTQTGEMQLARIPARRLQVVASSAAVNPGTVATPDEVNIEPAGAVLPGRPVNGESRTLLFWQLLSGILASICLFGSYYIWRLRKLKAAVSEQTAIAAQDMKMRSLLKGIKQACVDNRPDDVRKALLKWSELYYSDPTLATLHRHCSPLLCEQLKLLERTLYSPAQGAGTWQGQAFWRAFKDNKDAVRHSQSTPGPLPELYPRI